MGAVALHIRQFPELLNLVVHFMTQCALGVNRENEKGLPDPDNRRTLSSPIGGWTTVSRFGTRDLDGYEFTCAKG